MQSRCTGLPAVRTRHLEFTVKHDRTAGRQGYYQRAGGWRLLGHRLALVKTSRTVSSLKSHWHVALGKILLDLAYRVFPEMKDRGRKRRVRAGLGEYFMGVLGTATAR